MLCAAKIIALYVNSKFLLSKWCVVKNESREWNVESYDYLCWELLLF